MFPLKDDIPSQRFPIVNTLMIVVCSIVFLIQLTSGEDALVESYGMIPARVLQPNSEITTTRQVPYRTPFGIEVRAERHVVAPSAVPAWMTVVTCIFLHGGWMHVLGNMWFLYIFGDNVEDRLGHLGYLLFYLFCGVGASLAHLVTGPDSVIPTIGASGAIAGVMGAYLVLYPRAMVLAVIPIFFIFQTIVLPAPFFLVFWFVMQLFQGTMSISSSTGAGVAWWAHIGGFVVGWVVAKSLQTGKLTNEPVVERRPEMDRVRYYRSFPRR